MEAEPKAETSNLQALANSEKKNQTVPETIPEHLSDSEQKKTKNKQFPESSDIVTFCFINLLNDLIAITSFDTTALQKFCMAVRQ